MAGSATRRLLPSLMAMHLRTLRLDRSCITASSLSSIATCIIPLTSTSLVLQHRLLPAVASDLAYNRHLLLTPNLLSVMTSACVLCPPNFDPLSPFESSVVETSRSALNFEALSAPPITVLDLEFRLKWFVI
jgi:hypothetical protein